jgi:SEC-C motif-containing protein
MNKTDLCPCGSGFDYGDCCEPYITGEKNAPTAEELMRSRYTAYVVHAIDYIMETFHEDLRGQQTFEGIKKWSEKSKWLGLKIISVDGGYGSCLRGTVRFEATYEMDNLHHVHHEIATFEKIDDRWFYMDGEVIPQTVVRVGEKIGRNDPCPCGSGKKYKHCCGR